MKCKDNKELNRDCEKCDFLSHMYGGWNDLPYIGDFMCMNPNVKEKTFKDDKKLCDLLPGKIYKVEYNVLNND